MAIDDIRSEFGARLVQERHRVGRSQADLARAAGISKPTQLAYEQGNRAPGLDYLMRMSLAGLDLWFLMWGTPQKVHVMQSFDWDLLAKIQEAMEQWALDNDLLITPSKRVELSRVVYELCLAKGAFSATDVDRVLKLVA
jgi:transcriptional regulator with XRE-family HTH domain